METFNFILVGSASPETIDTINKQLLKLVRDLTKKGVDVESANLNAGHFLGGSRSLVDSEETEVGGDE